MTNKEDRCLKNISSTTPTFMLSPEFPVEYCLQGAVPSAYIRSALFGVVKKGTAKFVNEKIICCQGENKICYTGEELTQSDLTIWLTIKKNCLPYKINLVELRSHDILKQLGKSCGHTDKKWLRKKITKLCSSLITVICGSRGITSNLLCNLSWLDDFETFKVSLDERILILFGDRDYTLLDISVRNSIKGDLAKWLYTYWSSHKTIFDIYDNTILKLCGSDATVQKEFRRSLKDALKELVAIGFLSSFEISRQGKVSVVRK